MLYPDYDLYILDTPMDVFTGMFLGDGMMLEYLYDAHTETGNTRGTPYRQELILNYE